MYKRQIARHPRREDGAETFEGLPGVHPDRFKPLDVWCEEHRRTRILEQWDYDANGGKGPHDCVCRSGRPVHWRCPDCGFEWVEAPARRTGRSFDDCLACADVALVDVYKRQVLPADPFRRVFRHRVEPIRAAALP